jgi:hypothetical protein
MLPDRSAKVIDRLRFPGRFTRCDSISVYIFEKLATEVPDMPGRSSFISDTQDVRGIRAFGHIFSTLGFVILTLLIASIAGWNGRSGSLSGRVEPRPIDAQE